MFMVLAPVAAATTVGTAAAMAVAAGFAAAARAQAGKDAPTVNGTSEIQEITVLGEWAFMWTQLTVVVTPTGGGPSMTRSGHTLSVLKKRQGKWVLARDANMLTPVTS